jgi:hypothetical protein
MAVMAPLPRSAATGLSRRSFLAATSAAGLALLVTGCTSAPEDEQDEPVTAAQVDSLAEQVAVQEQVVAAYAAAGAADTALARRITDLAEQADAQLTRLRAAAPDGEPSSPASSSSAPAPSAGPEPRAWLRAQVAGAADSHARACLEQSGGRAALLGSIAAGLRGHAALLA